MCFINTTDNMQDDDFTKPITVDNGVSEGMPTDNDCEQSSIHASYKECFKCTKCITVRDIESNDIYLCDDCKQTSTSTDFEQCFNCRKYITVRDIESNGMEICVYCGQRFLHPDCSKDTDLYTEMDCRWVCINCVDKVSAKLVPAAEL